VVTGAGLFPLVGEYIARGIGAGDVKERPRAGDGQAVFVQRPYGAEIMLV